MFTYPLSVRISQEETGLKAALEHVSGLSMTSGSDPVTARILWKLSTVFDDGVNTSDCAQFGSLDGQKKGIEITGLPAGVTVDDKGLFAENLYRIDFSIPPNSDGNISYLINFTFQNREFSPDPVIVVTPEPVATGSVVLDPVFA